MVSPASKSRTQFETLNLAGLGLRQAVHHFDFARIGMIAHHAAHNGLNVRRERRAGAVAWPQRDVGLDDVTLERIGLADYRGLGNGRMVQDRAFYFERADAVG